MDRNEAIDIVRKNQPYGRHQLSEALETLIPELKESEDEKIRKELISFITDRKNWFPKEETKASWIAWLEKQGSIGKINEKLGQYREYLVKETESWHKKEEDETLSKIGRQDCIGHANAFISARAEFEEMFDYDSWNEKTR